MTAPRILVVEDEYLIALELEAVLADAGYLVEHAATEREALARIAADRWDAAIADANLHGRGVDRIAAALTERGVPFAIASGYGRESLPPVVAHVPLIEKPFDGLRLLRTVARLLAPPR